MVRDLGSKTGGNSRQSRVPFRMKSGPGPRWVEWPSTAREQRRRAGRTARPSVSSILRGKRPWQCKGLHLKTVAGEVLRSSVYSNGESKGLMSSLTS